ncbi:hypothetical protein MOE77_16970, partial [Bacillus inaquosorum]|nr:hypothetical protein [Bacillus inaquosorum]
KLVDSEYFPLIIKSFPKESLEKLGKATVMLQQNIDELSKKSQEEANNLILQKVEEIENGNVPL